MRRPRFGARRFRVGWHSTANSELRRAGLAPLDSGIKRGIAVRQGPLGVPTVRRAQSALKTVSGGEFDWGGTSVKSLPTPASGGNDMAALEFAPRRLVEPRQEVFTVPPISAGGNLYDIHPMRRGGDKSFVDDLVLGRGVVISRAATSLRSVETQPLTRRFVRIRRATISDDGQGQYQNATSNFFGARRVDRGTARAKPPSVRARVRRGLARPSQAGAARSITAMAGAKARRGRASMAWALV
ncbi:hypothetical protein EGW08_023809 [Elysia chlorotica]|uniref:Uncharacterized protein n=1 Tax=Elysia chlorotica TaxID=188477 RepID=A0A3S1AZV6_ELYCH|nr:hypothetical protein EGW08_023809 [Elysia chlorotica]